MIGKKLYTFTNFDDTTPIQKLSLRDQFRLMIKRLANSDQEQLKAEDAVTSQELTLKADLLEFLYKSTDPVRKGFHKSVTVAISSRFLPVLTVVLESTSIANYYDVNMRKPDIEYDIDYNIFVTLEVKAY